MLREAKIPVVVGVAVGVVVVVAVVVAVAVVVVVGVGVGEHSFMNIARIRELLDEKEYPITGDSPLARYALELRDAIGPLLDRVEKMEAENNHLRASVANNGGPCIYCNLPKNEWARCADGFPGCGRADDAMLCPNVGAALEAEEQLAALQAAPSAPAARGWAIKGPDGHIVEDKR